MRKLYILSVLILFFAGYAFSVQKMETVLADGKTILLPLAPVDPRALLMGDYMDLRYIVNTDIRAALAKAKVVRDGSNPSQSKSRAEDTAVEGFAVLRISNEPVPQAASFIRLDDGKPLLPGEFLLGYRIRGRAVTTVATAFYFQEGTARQYEKARFGQFKVADNGKTVLVGLCDKQGKLIAPGANADAKDEE
ncbi:MAG: GDYXXLXY domain-containing protein [Desulfovibrio sp.]|uniref:GDYXXLXY domain-containing protein n=1 Tax=Desulfovibrio sp. TaxID=885 RepID=UPI0039E39540